MANTASASVRGRRPPMLEWLAANIASVVIVFVLAAVVTLIIMKLVRDKKRGRHACSCGGDCKSCGVCRTSKDR